VAPRHRDGVTPPQLRPGLERDLYELTANLRPPGLPEPTHADIVRRVVARHAATTASAILINEVVDALVAGERATPAPAPPERGTSPVAHADPAAAAPFSPARAPGLFRANSFDDAEDLPPPPPPPRACDPPSPSAAGAGGKPPPRPGTQPRPPRDDGVCGACF